MKNILLFTSFFAALASAQIAQFIREPDLQTGLYVKNVWVGDSHVGLITLPTLYSFCMTNNLSVDAATSPAFATSSSDNSSVLQLSNTKFRVSYLYQNLVLGTLGLKIPTSFNQYSNPELFTVGDVATRQLSFQYSNLFNSFDICAGLSSSLAFKDVGEGDLSVGLGLSYLYKGPFTPSEEMNQEFSPGNEFNASTAAEYVFIAYDRKITAMADLGFTLYGDDQFGDAEKIEVGGKFNWALFAATELTDVWPVSVRLANYRKGANANVGRLGETAKSASDLLFTASSGIPLWTDYKPYGRLTLASYAGGGAGGFGDAFILTINGGAIKRLMEHVFLSGEMGFDMGSLEKSGVFGFELQGTVNYKF
jgi:hypothetical protein